MGEETDYRARARLLERNDFVAQNPFPFLLGLGRLAPPDDPLKTQRGPVRMDPAITLPTGIAVFPPPGLTVRAVRKVQALYPDMITVGRAPNNDVVLQDGQVSKFHAWFRQGPAGMELVDAGSRNGTYVDEKRLPGRSSGLVVRTGQTLRFGDLAFRYLDAATLWAAARAL